ncbi:hypothetical protein SKAU_G00145740 [Synaphobranchus kaupii]|uniref:Uncharacterized protein n=1 Tax=Synaphobranchus kaupii TaxID=118154 RepID=A0A9Q1FTD3_SYNKA|nr:hypothetical protein SKAU_G00145740 [Synaphobranchus kaupii]
MARWFQHKQQARKSKCFSSPSRSAYPVKALKISAFQQLLSGNGKPRTESGRRGRSRGQGAAFRRRALGGGSASRRRAGDRAPARRTRDNGPGGVCSQRGAPGHAIRPGDASVNRQPALWSHAGTAVNVQEKASL